MSLKAEIKPATELGKRSRTLLDRARETRRPVILTVDGEAEGVLLDIESYREMRDAMGLLKLVNLGEQDVRAGRLTDLDEAFAEIDGSISALRARRK